MDPITHAIVGAGLAGLSGGEMSITNPIVIASMVGAVAPDLDIVYQVRGDLAYLKRHRGFSHSIPGLALFSVVIAGILKVMFPEAFFTQLLLWTFVGALSHTLLDVLNSYGAEIFAPISNKKYTLNLLMITDPVLLLLFLGIIFLPGNKQVYALVAVLSFTGYLLYRYMLRKRVERHLREHFAHTKLKNLAVLPSMVGLWTWDFVLETERKCLVGQIKSFGFNKSIRKKWMKPKIKTSKYVEAALASNLGKLFKEFTPHYHLVLNQVNDKYIVRFFDLRYMLKKEFLHTGTAVLNCQQEVIEANFYPYSVKRKVNLGA